MKSVGVLAVILFAVSGCELLGLGDDPPAPDGAAHDGQQSFPDAGGDVLGPYDDAALPPPAKTTTIDVSSEGGSQLITHAGAVESFEISLPAGILEAGESATVDITYQASADETVHAAFTGAEFLLGLKVEVGSDDAALREKIEEGLEINIDIDSQAAIFPTDQQTELNSDAVSWASKHLFLSAVPDATAEHAAKPLCKTPDYGKKAKLPIAIHVDWIAGKNGPPSRVRLKAQLATFAKFTDAKLGEVLDKANGKLRQIWFAIKPVHTIDHSNDYTGPIKLRYYPIGISPTAPPTPWPSGDDEKKVTYCLKRQIDAVAGILKKQGFKPWKTTVDGKGDTPLPTTILVYDYQLNPNVAASANAVYRMIYMYSSWIKPELYIAMPDGHQPKEGQIECVDLYNTEAKKKLASFAHEMFHIQQGAYLMPPDNREALFFGYQVWYDGWWKTDEHGPYTLTEKLDRNHTLWFLEATARYFQNKVVPPDSPWLYHGLANFGLETPPWAEIDGKVYADTIARTGYWAYARYVFFKYLFDREKDVLTHKELSGLAELFTHVAKYQEDLRKGGSGYSAFQYISAVEDWMEYEAVPKRDWFGFFREFSLLRGCKALTDCPHVPIERANPFGKLASPETVLDLTGGQSDYDILKGLYAKSSAYYEFFPTPFSSPGANEVIVDEGKTIASAKACSFDTTQGAYAALTNKAETVRANWQDQQKVEEIEFPVHINYQLAGTRLDIVDNMEYGGNQTYLWELEFGSTCRIHSLKAEAWRYADVEKSMRYVDEGDGESGITFITEKPEEGSAPTVVLLVGNTETRRSVAEGLEKPCTATLKITLVSCPCESMSIVNDGGGPDDNLLNCNLSGGGSLNFCWPEEFLVDAAFFKPKEEYKVCFKKHSQIASFCKLGLDDYETL